eukprot:TRINITY_DN11556_c0_g2_i1.p1 TRINITY_DN11556_c0_g2~~TRINITY_DN11556_c0_g2_i1.p1  ORF type:complete len:387 (+),score=156.35 TRINITY_DN11556_c0_g2_i1:49-1209(+)
MRAYLALAAFVACASATVFFEEKFGEGWEDRWVQSEAKSDYGEFKVSAGKYYNDAEEDKGLQTSQDAKFYAMSAKFDEFANEGKDLVIQFIVKHEQNIDCGGGYVKVFPASVDGAKMDGESPYNIMFGPDICGPGTRKVHVIFAYKGDNKQVSKTIACKYDEASHLYTLIVRPDNTYEVRIDGDKVESGNIEDDFDMLPPKEINDPSVSKPEDWVDEKQIPDPEDTKPEDWDQPEHIADPDAEKPEDWDDEMDGEWEAPNIPNPEYKGEWKPKMIDNPEYKGEWVHPQIANPDYEADDKLYSYDSFGVIGLDLWQVKSGSIFDNILITDDVATAETAVKDFKTRVEGEKKMKEAEEAKKKAEEEAAKEAEEDEDEDEDDEDAKEEL